MFADNALQISVDNKNHKSLERRVMDHLNSRNFMTASATYHDVMPKEIKDRLSRLFDLTSLYLRGRSDRIAVHKILPITFEWEAKTHVNSKYQDLTVEALPMMQHIIKSWLGVKCLYVFEINGNEGGFWVHEIPQIRCAWIPPRREYEEHREFFIKRVRWLFKDMNIVENPVGGTGDPFFIIDKEQIARLINWRILIDELLQQ